MFSYLRCLPSVCPGALAPSLTSSLTPFATGLIIESFSVQLSRCIQVFGFPNPENDTDLSEALSTLTVSFDAVRPCQPTFPLRSRFASPVFDPLFELFAIFGMASFEGLLPLNLSLRFY